MSDIEFWDERWQVPARTIDMLGRQQIANIPTALHELFKNAHDAYADNVTADFFPDDRLLVVRDDGDGMDAQQLRSGWLTLASSSRLGANDAPSSEVGIRRPRRAVMGEKGIGRLAIASIGPQVLIMTRARSTDGSVAPLLVSMVHWGVNKLPDVDLSRIVVPSMRLSGGSLPDQESIKRLASRLAENVAALRSDLNTIEIDGILSDLNAVDFDPAYLSSLPGPSLADGGSGTQFAVFPTDEMLVNDMRRPSEEEPTQLEKYLLGFSNTMMPDRPTPAIKASFNVHWPDATESTLIGEGAFFTPDEFRQADHAIEGDFDAYGHFHGYISVYGGERREHRIAWPDAVGRPTLCGPFRINFAYLQGNARDSRLPPHEWAEMSGRLNRMGGLYVYRDGIRVLPYGGPEQDFVGIERRRTKSAADWFFSYRRMFGAVEITHAQNSRLREKAGREGFIRDGAYNDFVRILSKFFENLAIDFFRDSSRHGDWAEAKVEVNRQARILESRNKRSKVKRAKMVKELDAFFINIEKAEFSRLANESRTRLTERLHAIPSLNGDPDRENAVLDWEKAAREAIEEIRRITTIDKPKGVGLTRKLESDWEAYRRSAVKIENEVITPLREELDLLLRDTISTHGIRVDRRRRIDAVINDRGDKAVNDAARLQRKVEKQLGDVREGVRKIVREAVAGLASEVEKTQVDLLSTNFDTLDESRAVALQSQWQWSIDQSADETMGRLDSMAAQLVSLMEAIGRGETLDQTTDALETQVEAYREQLDQFVELAQLGTAVGIVQHEFSSAVTRVRSAIRKLGPWVKANPDLGSIDRDLRDGFEHLDAYLNLFAPLSRRLNKTRLDLSGTEVRTYLDEVFGERLRRHGVKILATPEFDSAAIGGQPSSILASFVNLMDNAIHWMGSIPKDERRILLDGDADGVTIANTGPAIDLRFAERIFEFGTTNRSGGRGMGLYVSREALSRSGLSLTLQDVGSDSIGPTFRIGPVHGEDGQGAQA